MLPALSIVLVIATETQAPVARQLEPGAPATEPAPATETSPPPAETAPAPTTSPAPPADSAVSDDAWNAVVGKQVIVETRAGEVSGELASADGANIVVIAPDGRVQSIPKANATGVRVANPPAPAADEDPQFPTEPPPDDIESTPSSDDEGASDDPADERERKRKERASKRPQALLGAYTAHGASYAHWRGDGINAGHAAYSMDLAVGVNPTPGFGIYALGGGLFGAKIDDKTVKANMGRVAFTFAFGGKWYFSTFGAGVAFSRLKFDTGTEKDVGLSLPMKAFAKFTLPKKLYLGIGLAFDSAIVRSFSRSVFGIGGQIVLGRW